MISEVSISGVQYFTPKAHQQVWKVLLQVLDDGRLTDAKAPKYIRYYVIDTMIITYYVLRSGTYY